MLNPATGEALGQLPHAMQADLDRVLETSATAFKVWKRMLAVDPRQDHAEGSEGGIEGLEAHTHTKLIVQQ